MVCNKTRKWEEYNVAPVLVEVNVTVSCAQVPQTSLYLSGAGKTACGPGIPDLIKAWGQLVNKTSQRVFVNRLCFQEIKVRQWRSSLGDVTGYHRAAQLWKA